MKVFCQLQSIIHLIEKNRVTNNVFWALQLTGPWGQMWCIVMNRFSNLFFFVSIETTHAVAVFIIPQNNLVMSLRTQLLMGVATNAGSHAEITPTWRELKTTERQLSALFSPAILLEFCENITLITRGLKCATGIPECSNNHVMSRQFISKESWLLPICSSRNHDTTLTADWKRMCVLLSTKMSRLKHQVVHKG